MSTATRMLPVERLGDVLVDLHPYLHGKGHAVITDGALTANIRRDGAYIINMDSRALAKMFMRPHDDLTNNVQDYWREYHRRIAPGTQPSTLTYLENWVSVHPYKTWGKPDQYPEGREHWLIGDYESGNTQNFTDDCWLGAPFEFVHFVTPTHEGAIIRWHEGGDTRTNYSEPEIWVGDFTGFMEEQNWCGWFETEGFLVWNDNLKGAFILALERMGSFQDERIELDPRINAAIRTEPDIAFKPVDIGVLDNPSRFDPAAVKAVREFVERHGPAWGIHK